MTVSRVAAVRAGHGRLGRFGIALARLAASTALTLAGLVVATFILGRIVPRDPVTALIGDNASPEAYHRLYSQLGLDQPIVNQIAIYVSNVLHGELGLSLVTGQPVLQDLAQRMPATVELATASTLIAVMIGVPAGVYAAARRNRLSDHLIRLLSLLAYSTPVFWLGLLALLLFYMNWGILPGPGRVDFFYVDAVPAVTGSLLLDSLMAGRLDVFWNAARHLVMPAAVLGLSSTAYITRMVRNAMIYQLSQEYIITAKVKGVSYGGILWRHAFKNVLVQVVTIVALSYGFALEGAVLTETIFGWPGIGSYAAQSLFRADMNGILGVTLLIGLVFILLNTATDAIYRLIDPRVA